MKIFKSINYFIICFITVVLEMTLGEHLEVCGIVPMLSFCLCLVIAVGEKNLNYIYYVSIILGAVFDLLSGHGFGTYTVLFALNAWVTITFKDSIFSSMTLFLVLDTFILTLFSNIVYYLLHIIDIKMGLGTMLTQVALPSALYNTVISIIFYLILKPNLYKRR